MNKKRVKVLFAPIDKDTGAVLPMQLWQSRCIKRSIFMLKLKNK